MARVDYKDMIKFTEEAIVKRTNFSSVLIWFRLRPMTAWTRGPHGNSKRPWQAGSISRIPSRARTKIEKITYGELHYMRRAIYSTINFTASDDYDLPVFSVEFDESATRIGATVVFMPLVDLSLHPQYQEKYLSPLADLWRKYRTIPGITKEGRCLVQRRYGPWAWARETMSPFSLDGRIEVSA